MSRTSPEHVPTTMVAGHRLRLRRTFAHWSRDGGDLETEDGTVTSGTQAFVDREIMDIKAAANYLGVSRSHLSHILAGKVAGVPAIPHVRAGRRALIRRVVIDRWLLEQEHGVATSLP
jgi:transcriptional regulator with XRE-family HTH domain